MTNNEVINKVKDVIVKGYKPGKIILFGSRATGKYREDSDVDLIIVKETKKRRYLRAPEVGALLWDVKPYQYVDFLIYTTSELEYQMQINSVFNNEVIKKVK